MILEGGRHYHHLVAMMMLQAMPANSQQLFSCAGKRLAAMFDCLWQGRDVDVDADGMLMRLGYFSFDSRNCSWPDCISYGCSTSSSFSVLLPSIATMCNGSRMCAMRPNICICICVCTCYKCAQVRNVRWDPWGIPGGLAKRASFLAHINRILWQNHKFSPDSFRFCLGASVSATSCRESACNAPLGLGEEASLARKVPRISNLRSNKINNHDHY